MISHLVFKKAICCLLLLLCCWGILARFYKITKEQFVYYDEGLYLNINRDFVLHVLQHKPASPEDWKEYLYYLLVKSLGTGKSLFLFLVDSRAFWMNTPAWFFPRFVSAGGGDG